MTSPYSSPAKLTLTAEGGGGKLIEGLLQELNYYYMTR